MGQISQEVTAYVLGQMSGKHGLNAGLCALRKTDPQAPAEVRSFLGRNVAGELMEKANQAHYPSVLVYCEKLSNTLREKFRTFSGTARITIEVRNSSDRLENLDRSSLIYADTVCGVLETMRGPWTDGLMYAGGYEVSYSPVKTGGRHFTQSTKVSFEVDVSE